jgi:hypothetical protein
MGKKRLVRSTAVLKAYVYMLVLGIGNWAVLL